MEAEMKKNTITSRLLAVMMLLVLVISLPSCTPKLKREDGKYVNSSKGLSYYAANGAFEPIAVGEKFCKLDDDELFVIGGLDPKKFVCEKNTKQVFYSTELEIPAFEDMTVEKIVLCYEEAIAVAFKTLTEPEDIEYVRDAYLNGERGYGFVSPYDIKDFMSIKFVFKELPGLYFSVGYTTGHDGTAIITDRFNPDRERYYIKADGLLDRFINSSDSSTGESSDVTTQK